MRCPEHLGADEVRSVREEEREEPDSEAQSAAADQSGAGEMHSAILHMI